MHAQTGTIVRPRFPAHAGDVLTAFRLAATPVFVWLVSVAPQRVVIGWLAVLVFFAVAASDFFDGRLARRAGGGNPRGRVLDHGADIAFLLAALITYVRLGLTPWWVPAAIALSFSTYVYDSWRPRAAPTRASRLGHYGGVMNWVVVGVLVCNYSAALNWLPAAVVAAVHASVPVYSLAAVAQRYRARVRPPVATPGTPG